MKLSSPTKNHKALSDDMTRQATVACLKEHLELDIQGTKATTEMALDIMMHAASVGQSIEASCAELESADSNTIRDYLNQAFRAETLGNLEAQVNAALAHELPKKVFVRAQELAIDLHDQPFYGKDEQLLAYACRGQAKAGTTYFYRIASSYLMLQGVRVTLGVVFVHSGMSLVEVVTALLEQVKTQGLRLRCLYLDKGFASNPIYQYLLDQHLPAMIPCPIRGKPEGQGTRALCKGRKSYLSEHNFHSKEHGDCTVPVAVVRCYKKTGKRGQAKKLKGSWCLYVLINLELQPEQCHGRYRRRFGIESSYRLMRQLRIRSNSRNPAMRFLYMALGLILVNVWRWLKFRFTQLPRRGRAGRVLDEPVFRLKRFASFLRHAVERRYPLCCAIIAAVSPLQD